MSDSGGPAEPRRQPDPSRPGTVYRSRRRLALFGRGRPARSLAARYGGTPTGADNGAGSAPLSAGAPVSAAGPDGWAPEAAAEPGLEGGVRADVRPSPPPYGPSDLRPDLEPGRPRTAAPARPARPPRRGRRTWLIALLVAVLIGYPLLLFTLAWTSLHKVDALGGADRVADTPGRTYLVVGSDSRADLSPAERRRLGTGGTTGQRTDTIMLLHVSASGGPSVLVSIPRDSYVPIPGHGRNKINAAYAFGGPQLLVRTVEGVSGVHIDGYVETGLGGYADLVDAIGGVRICAPRAMKDHDAHLDIAAGCQRMDGATALGYARARKSDPRGDLGRVERQRQVLAAIAGKTLSPAVLALPWRSIPAARAGGGALTVDQGTSPFDLSRFVLAMRAVAGGRDLSLTVPISNPNLATPAGDAVQWDRAKALRLFDAIKADDTEAIRPLVQQQAARTG